MVNLVANVRVVLPVLLQQEGWQASAHARLGCLQLRVTCRLPLAKRASANLVATSPLQALVWLVQPNQLLLQQGARAAHAIADSPLPKLLRHLQPQVSLAVILQVVHLSCIFLMANVWFVLLTRVQRQEVLRVHATKDSLQPLWAVL